MAYTIEEEQELNELKTWWKENYKVLIASVVLAFAGVFGWNYWQSYQTAQAQQASFAYEQLIHSAQDPQSKDAQFNQFLQANNKTAYAVLALFDQAKTAVDQQNFAQAETWLQQALSQSNDEILSSVSALRLAMVQFQQNKLDDALKSLEQVKSSSWASAKALLMGDIALAKQDKEQAKAHYQQALQTATATEKEWLEVRLNNL